MAHHLLDLDARGFRHTHRVLAEYASWMDPGLVPLGARRALLPEVTRAALEAQYGPAGWRAVLHRAGVDAHRLVDETEALDLLRARDPAALPARPAAPPSARLWHLDAVGARAAWNHWGGADAIAWGGVKVGQVDTGYTPHPVFGFPATPRIDVAGGRTFYAEGSGPGGEGPGGGIDPIDAQMDGHGTRIASVIAGDDPAAPGGRYLGAAPRVEIVPVRIANHVFISHAQRELARALRYLVQDAGVTVINLSMGFLPRVQMGVLDRAIDFAYERGVILVCAAGQPLSSVVSPAHGRRTIAVAGSTRAGVPWGQSAFGSAVDWTAPAQGIFRAETAKDGTPRYADDGDGTSYATALTTGAAALWVARHGTAALAAAYPQPWQRVEAFKAVAKATARPMPNQQPGSFGAGILQIDQLLAAPLPPAGSLQQEAPA